MMKYLEMNIKSSISVLSTPAYPLNPSSPKCDFVRLSVVGGGNSSQKQSTGCPIEQLVDFLFGMSPIWHRLFAVSGIKEAHYIHSFHPSDLSTMVLSP